MKLAYGICLGAALVFGGFSLGVYLHADHKEEPEPCVESVRYTSWWFDNTCEPGQKLEQLTVYGGADAVICRCPPLREYGEE